MALENGGFDLPLQTGENEVEIAIRNDLRYASNCVWGSEFRFDNVGGLNMQAAKPAM